MQETKDILLAVADAIRQTGFDPYEQLMGYISTGELVYITRRNRARELIRLVDKNDITRFMKELK